MVLPATLFRNVAFLLTTEAGSQKGIYDLRRAKISEANSTKISVNSLMKSVIHCFLTNVLY